MQPGLKLLCADGVSEVELGAESYSMRELDRCLVDHTDTRMLQAAIASLWPHLATGTPSGSRISQGPTPGALLDGGGNSALHWAAYYGNDYAASVLLEQSNASPNDHNLAGAN